MNLHKEATEKPLLPLRLSHSIPFNNGNGTSHYESQGLAVLTTQPIPTIFHHLRET